MRAKTAGDGLQVKTPPLNSASTSTFWSNYSDLTRPHPKWWFSKGNPLISGKSRLVKYYNLARTLYGTGENGWLQFTLSIHQLKHVFLRVPCRTGARRGVLALALVVLGLGGVVGDVRIREPFLVIL